jgi:CspA family cold shock protein
MTTAGTSTGVVREWYAEEGCGVLDSASTPGGCWAHFSAVQVEGYRSLTPADRVHFTFEAAEQDGYSYRAVDVWPPGVEPRLRLVEPTTSSDAFRSRLTVTFDDDEV